MYHVIGLVQVSMTAGKSPVHKREIMGPQRSRELAGCVPEFPKNVGHSLAQSLELPDFRRKQLLFNRLMQPGDVHVYSTECHAGERLRAQTLIPILSLGSGLAPSFAVVAQSLPYSADVQQLPFDLPAGFSAVVAPPPGELAEPLQDLLTRANYYPGPVIDTRTLVSGRCYIVVWSPQNQMGKYVLHLGHSWPWTWFYWLQIPLFWWRIRGWFGLSRTAVFLGGLFVLSVALMGWAFARRR